jgi:YidC/Oxa1 family membrane protein insertase
VENQRNMIMAIVLSALVLFGWSALSERYFPAPKPATKQAAPVGMAGGSLPGAAPTIATARDVKAVLAEGGRVPFTTPRISGSINLKGARIDDLVLLAHRETVAKGSPPVRLLSPAGTKASYFASFGWAGQGVALPGDDTVWQADAAMLTPEKPVTLRWDNGQGQVFSIRVAIDKDYMFTVDQSVANNGAAAIKVNSYGLIRRDHKDAVTGSPFVPRNDQYSWTMHVGPLGDFGSKINFDMKYATLDEAGADGMKFGADTKWLGFGQTYWLTALIPGTGNVTESKIEGDANTYQAAFAGKAAAIGPKSTTTSSTRFFAGAKEVDVLNRYQDAGVPNFGNAIDWGWFWFIEKPLFKLLDFLFKLFGNFGVAIIGLTFVVRGFMFPIAQRQFASMASMRAVQPKLKLLQDRYKDDKPRLQQEMMKLYKDEKINPLGGCLPIFLQIPIFYGLYKVLMVTIEMRHQPFIGWIKDLSGPDPANLVNLAGLAGIPLPAFLGIGLLALLMGLTMWMQFKLNPAAPDPVQQQMFSIMPWIMMFVMSPYAAGLLLYWVTSNILTIAQQKWLYSKHPALKVPVTK